MAYFGGRSRVPRLSKIPGFRFGRPGSTTGRLRETMRWQATRCSCPGSQVGGRDDVGRPNLSCGPSTLTRYQTRGCFFSLGFWPRPTIWEARFFFCRSSIDSLSISHFHLQAQPKSGQLTHLAVCFCITSAVQFLGFFFFSPQYDTESFVLFFHVYQQQQIQLPSARHKQRPTAGRR